MYSHEIQEFLSQHNYQITSEQFLHICDTSSQINGIVYDPFNDVFKIVTDDNYCWIINVIYIED